MKRVSLLTLMLAVTAAAASFGDCPHPPAAAITPWVRGLREAAGLAVPAHDPVLARAAGEYAQVLAARGVLAHRDEQGRNVLGRLRAAGGTPTLAGEILGSGFDAAEICSAWAASEPHRSVVLNPLWTHLGVGCAAVDSRQVWVVVFAARRMPELRIEAPRVHGASAPGSPAGFRVSGRLPAGRGLEPVLLSGLDLREPELWLPHSGLFAYTLPPEAAEVYHRLGYRDAGGSVTITDAFYPARAATCVPETAPR